MRKYIQKITSICIGVIMVIGCGMVASYAITDTYYEDFDNYVTNDSIDGVDSWDVTQGESDDAVTQAITTMTGTGNALQITGAQTSVNVSRPASYGALSPCWVEFYIMPGIGAQTQSLPTGKIAAVSFDFTGKIYASDGEAWTDTGATFQANTWYRVLLELDFSAKQYNLYISLAETTIVEELTALKSDLSFIDTSINSLSDIGFEGTYNSARPDNDDSYIDNFVVYFVDRLEIITPSQSLAANEISGPITVQLQDSYSAPQTAWKDITLEARSSSVTGEFSMDKDSWNPITQVILSENAQAVTFYYKDSTEGKPMINISEYPDSGWTDALQEFSIAGESEGFDISVDSPQIAGAPFDIIITARADDGTVDTLYDGELEILVDYINPETGTEITEPHTVSGFEEGVLTAGLIYSDCGTIEIIVHDDEDSSKMGNSGPILFVPASFEVKTDTPQVVNRDFTLEVSARDIDGSVTPNYKGPAGLKVIAVTPEETDGELSFFEISSEEFSGGMVEKEISYNRWGSIKIEAYDKAYADKLGQSGQIDFQADSFVIEVSSPPGGRDFFYVGEKIDITMSMLDPEDAAVSNYTGLINITSSLGLGLPNEYQFVIDDGGIHTFSVSLSHAGTYSASAVDSASELTADSSNIVVKEATIEVISDVAPIGTTDIVIQLVDENGNVITTENDVTITVSLDEEHDNTTASSSATTTPITFKKGIAKVIISNTQAEIVTITPISKYDFKVKKGTVTFGRTAKTGIGTIMWREIKD